MIKDRRHRRILEILQADGSASLADIHARLPVVSRVTLRRDLAELAEAGALRRTRGGATLPDAEVLRHPGPRLVPSPEFEVAALDAVILPPVGGRGGEALRRRIARSGMPFLAESAPQQGGVYLGPDNRRAAWELGLLAGREAPAGPAAVLIVGHPDLPNTRERADGFEAGFREARGAEVRVVRVNGQGGYRASFRVALDALRAHEDVGVAFAINDHAALAAMDAAERAGREVAVYATGGEAPDFVARLGERGALRAVAAFFPEVVGARGIDIAAAALAGAPLPPAAVTPHAILAPGTVGDWYAPSAAGGWGLIPARRDALVAAPIPGPIPGPDPRRPAGARRRVGFMPHFPAHDWYRVMIEAMRERAALHGLALVVAPPHQGIAAELARLRRGIAACAAGRIAPGQTVVLGEGEATRFMADEIGGRAARGDARLAGVTVVTNALDVLERLHDAPGLKVVLTGGEYQAADRCLVGPQVGALFEQVRVDQAFLTVAGITPEFGLSAMDERLALAGSRLLRAARRRVALADHTAIGVDATHRVARAAEAHEVITDDGALPADRQRLRAAGIEVLVAGDGDEEDRPRPERNRTVQGRTG